MFEYIVGSFIEDRGRYIVLESNNIGYKIFCSRFCASSLKGKVKLYIHQHIKEDSHNLYGFVSTDERTMFEAFIATNGIGPKLALDILSEFNISQLKDCILNERYDILTRAPGLGMKKAKKLVIETKEKIKHISTDTTNDFEYDLIDALVNLGYSKKEIKENLGNYSSLEEGIKDMLTKLQ